MAEELKPLDISHVPELRRLVEEVRAAERARVLQVNHQDVAILVPAPRRGTKQRRGKATNADDPLWNIVGLARSDGPGDVSEHIDASLAQAYCQFMAEDRPLIYGQGMPAIYGEGVPAIRGQAVPRQHGRENS